MAKHTILTEKGEKMPNTNPPLKKVLMFVAIGTLSFTSTMLAAEISGLELKNLLTEKDQISNSVGYKTSFVMTMNANPSDPNQGIVMMDCAVTSITGGPLAMKITYYYEHIPVFVPPESRRYKPFEYEEDGSLVIWRPLEKHILFAPDRNETIEKKRVFFAHPDGEIVDTRIDHTTLFRLPIGSPDSIYQFNQYQLATGKGFSKHLDTVKSVKSLSSGLLKVTSQGSFGPSWQGTWELTVDPNADYLVREGIFTPDGADKPTTIVTSSGVVMKDELKHAKYGVLKYSNLLELSVEVTDISKVVGANSLYEEVLLRLDSPLAPGTHIMDLRGEKAVRTVVK